VPAFIDQDLRDQPMTADLVIYLVPGDHGTINIGNNLNILGQKLTTWLE